MKSNLLLLAVLLLAGCRREYPEYVELETIAPAHKACALYGGLAALQTEFNTVRNYATGYRARCVDGTVIEGEVMNAE